MNEIKKYFIYGEGVHEFFSTEKEALEEAEKLIDLHIEDGEWYPEVEDICVGVITHKAMRVNTIHKPSVNKLEDGFYDPDTGIDWSRIDMQCDYKMKFV